MERPPRPVSLLEKTALVVEPSDQRQKVFDSLDLKPNGIKKVETDKRLLKLKLAQQDITLSPITCPRLLQSKVRRRGVLPTTTPGCLFAIRVWKIQSSVRKE